MRQLWSSADQAAWPVPCEGVAQSRAKDGRKAISDTVATKLDELGDAFQAVIGALKTMSGRSRVLSNRPKNASPY